MTNPEILWDLFVKLLRVSILTIVCLLDGMDECDEESQEWLSEKFTSYFFLEDSDLGKSTIKLLIVSRDIPNLRRIKKQVNLDPDNDRLVDSDVKKFITARVEELSDLIGFSQKFYGSIESELLQRSEGTFLWVGLVMVELRKKKTITEIEETLQSLPKGLPAVYARMLLQIEESRRDQCTLALLWVAHAGSPLEVQDLGVAIGSQSPSRRISPDQAVRDIVSFCGPILKVHKGRLGLVHQSAKDYLLRREPDQNRVLENFRLACRSEDADLRIAQTCIDCLENVTMQIEAGDIDWERDGAKWTEHPLLFYATVFWTEHATHSSSVTAKLLRDRTRFFEDSSRAREFWWQAYNFWRSGDSLRNVFPSYRHCTWPATWDSFRGCECFWIKRKSGLERRSASTKTTHRVSCESLCTMPLTKARRK